MKDEEEEKKKKKKITYIIVNDLSRLWPSLKYCLSI